MNYIMTHYMELMAFNQPWNLLFYLAIPIVCSEILAIAELVVLYSKKDGTARRVSKITGIFSGIYFLCIFLLLLVSVVIPLTVRGEWRGIIDIVAISLYLLGIVPFVGMMLYEFNLIGRKLVEPARVRLHARLVGFLLVSSHFAMMFGMLNPHVFLL